MKRLLIDLGNSRLKWTLAGDAGALAQVQAIEHHGDPASALAQIGEAVVRAVDAVWIASVMGELHAAHLHKFADERWGVSLHEAKVTDGVAGLKLAYAQPQRLGVDRWLTMLALRSESHAAFAVAGAGTALTFDAVDAHGRHLGGLIAPGLNAMQHAVLDRTRFAVEGTDVTYEDGLGTDTEACVRQGAWHAVTGALDRLAQHHVPESPDTRLILCGGDAARLAPALADPRWQRREHLVLEGLQALAQRVTG